MSGRGMVTGCIWRVVREVLRGKVVRRRTHCLYGIRRRLRYHVILLVLAEEVRKHRGMAYRRA